MTDGLGTSSQILQAFEEVSLLSTRKNVALNDVLRLVGQRLCELMQVSRCSVYLRREDGCFQGQVGYSVNRENIDQGIARLVSGGSRDRFTAEILEALAPVVVRDASSDPRTIQKTMRRWGVRDMLGVPLVVEGEVIGIIYLDDEGHDKCYTDHDINVAQAFAALSALAVQQAWLFGKLAERSKVIDHQRRVLGESTAIHQRVTRAVLDGAETETILEVISNLLGKPVVLYDSSFRPLHWTAPETAKGLGFPGLTPAQLKLPLVRRTLAQLDETTPVIVMRATAELRYRRLVAKLAADGQELGYLELCEFGRRLGPVDSEALTQAALAVSVKVLSEQRRTEALDRERDDYLSDLLHRRRDVTSLTARASEFGIDVARAHAIIRFEYASSGDLPETAAGRDRRVALHGAISRALARIAGCKAFTGVPGADVFLIEAVSDDRARTQSTVVHQLKEIVASLDAQFGVRRVVVSEMCRSMSELAVMGTDIREVAKLLADDTLAPTVVGSWDFALVRLVAHPGGLGEAAAYSERLLKPLREHDAHHDGDFALTLQTFVECGAQIRTTASRLGVHENTVRYRLRRIEAISTIEPEDLSSLTLAHLAFQVASLSRPTLDPRPRLNAE